MYYIHFNLHNFMQKSVSAIATTHDMYYTRYKKDEVTVILVNIVLPYMHILKNLKKKIAIPTYILIQHIPEFLYCLTS